MATQTLTAPGLLSRLAGHFRRGADTGSEAPAADAAAARRDFINEMLTRNPDAFASELDIQNMMHHFPARF